MLSKIPYKIDTINKIDKGLTNDNYLITIDNTNYIMRYPNDDTKTLFNRKNEQVVLEKIKGLPFVLNTLYYQDGVQIVKYEEDLIDFENYNDKDKIKKVALLMQEFHSSNIKIDFDFDPIKQLYKYSEYVDDSEINLNDLKELFNKVENHTFNKVLCHNDWVAGNICFIDNKTYLIDYEYAGNNDRYFDIMSFITENDLSDSEKKEFLSYMFKDGISSQDEEILMMYRDLNNVLWYFWAKMMYSLRSQDIYNEISEIKLKQFNEEYKKRLNFI